MTVQDALRKRCPHLFDETQTDPDFIRWRDDDRWNKGDFRWSEIMKLFCENVTGFERQFISLYCSKEENRLLRHYTRWGDDLIKDVPRPLWVKWYETCVKIDRYINKLDASPRNLFKLFFISMGSTSLLASFVVFSPILWIATGFSGVGYWCMRENQRER